MTVHAGPRRLTQIADRPLPVTVLWRNTETLVHPDSVLADFDSSPPEPLHSSPTLPSQDYAKARDYIRRQFEAPPSLVPYEGVDYRMVRIELANSVPRITGALNETLRVVADAWGKVPFEMLGPN